MKRFKDILYVAVAGEASKPALERAVTLAENNQARPTVVGATERITAGIGIPDGGPISAELQTAMVSIETDRLNKLVDPYRKRMDIQTKVLQGTPFLEIIRAVLRDGHDLVIKAPETGDWLDRLIGSDDMHLLRKCPCPVWLIKPQTPKAHRRILAAVDVHDIYPPAELESRRVLNQQVLEIAISLALADFAELHIVHVWDAIGESAMRGVFMSATEQQIKSYVEQNRLRSEECLDRLINEMTCALGEETMGYLKPHKHLVKSQARKEIPVIAKQIDADLVVMGTVARTGLPGFIMGNTAESILNQINCSVFAIKPPDFITPVTLEI